MMAIFKTGNGESGNGKWGMGNGKWGMGNGEWEMGNGEQMTSGQWGTNGQYSSLK